MASIDLTIGGVPESNEGDVDITLPATVGRHVYTATFTIGERAVSDNATVNTIDKVWDAGTPLAGGDLIRPLAPANGRAVVLEQGHEIELEVGETSDIDHWRLGDEEGTDADTLITEWSVFNPQYAGTFSSPDARTTRWQAPMLPEGANAVEIQVKVKIRDTPKAIGASETGTRDDEPDIEHTVFVMVKRRVWEERPALAQHRETDGPRAGGLVPDGRMKSPQDQRVEGYDREFELVVGPGARIPCEVEGATDLDTLVQVNGTEGEQSDTVNYRWQAEGEVAGEWEWQEEQDDGTLVTRRGASAPVARATWIVPSDIDQQKQVTLKCTLDDKPGDINAPLEGGKRDDEVVELTVKVKIVVASLSLELVRQSEAATATEAATYESVTGDVGGQVFASLEVTLGRGVRVTSNTARLRFHEKPSGSITHDADEDHAEAVVSFAQAAGWQKFFDPDGAGPKEEGWWPAPEAPNAAVVVEGQDESRYRALVSWQTASAWPSTDVDGTSSKLLGHNGEHEVTLHAVDEDVDEQVQVTSGYGGNLRLENPDEVTGTVENLVITDVSTNVNEDYFIFNPDSDNSTHHQPEFTFKIKDEGDAHKYRWWIYIEPTTQTEPVQSWTFMSGTTQGAQTVTTTWNGKAGDGTANQEQLVPGTYTFDILVEEVNSVENLAEPLLDETWLKSDYLQISKHYLQINDNIEEDRKAEVGVKLSDQNGQAASNASVDLLDFNFNLVKSAGLPTAVGVEHGPINIHQLSENEE